MRRCADVVILEAYVEGAEVDFVIKQMVQRVLEDAVQ
jgi:hypothetical protein